LDEIGVSRPRPGGSCTTNSCRASGHEVGKPDIVPKSPRSWYSNAASSNRQTPNSSVVSQRLGASSHQSDLSRWTPKIGACSPWKTERRIEPPARNRRSATSLDGLGTSRICLTTNSPVGAIFLYSKSN